jgi:hypothetical protein
MGGRIKESRYYYAELLAVSCIYDVLLGDPVRDNEVQAAYREIGRLDRWDTVEKVLDHLRNNDDVAVFKGTFSRLLLP